MDLNIQDKTKDRQLNEIPALTWLPWIGKDFSKAPQRLLIIGESHYSDGATPLAFEENRKLSGDKEFTRNMIAQTQLQKAYQHKAIDNLFNAFFGNKKINTEKFWGQVAYYNFVQRSMDYSNINGIKKTEQPNIADFDRGWEVFAELVKILQPTDCVFIGVRAAEPFERMIDKLKISRSNRVVHPEINGVNPRSASVTVEGNNIKLSFIKHTSAYFSPPAWQPFLQQHHKEVLSQLA